MSVLLVALTCVRLPVCPALALLASILPAAAQKVEFNRDVRPIMADTCFRCHGPDKSSRFAGMRLDIREEALKPNPSGAVPIVPGKPERSAIIQRVFAASPAKRMPPAYANKDLTEGQKQTLRRWVAEGAEYQRHWAYLPAVRPPVPDTPGARNPVDAFIRARLRREGLQWRHLGRSVRVNRPIEKRHKNMGKFQAFRLVNGQHIDGIDAV